LSRSRVAGLVCEGPTDVPILEELITRLWPEVETVLTLQPEVDEAGRPTGTMSGWTAVKAWCEQNASHLETILRPGIGDDLDLLVIALDVDIAIDARIVDHPSRKTPYDGKRLCTKVKEWLSEGRARRLPRELVIALPAMSIEAWALAALFPGEKRPETLASPATVLANRKKLRIRDDGSVAKDLRHYEGFSRVIASRLQRVRDVCPEADRLCRKVEVRRGEVEKV